MARIEDSSNLMKLFDLFNRYLDEIIGSLDVVKIGFILIEHQLQICSFRYKVRIVKTKILLKRLLDYVKRALFFNILYKRN